MMLLKALLVAAIATVGITLQASEAHPAGQDPVPDDRDEKIRRALEWLMDSDPEIRDLGRKELLGWGREVMPKLEELLKAKGALEIYRIVREIELGKSGPVSEIPGPLLSHEEFLKRIGKPDGTAPDAYVRARMADIYKLFKEKKYQNAYDMVHALLVLEPKSRYAKELHQFRRTCDNMVTQSSIVRSRILAPHSAAAGSKVDFVLRMENVWKGGIEIHYDKEVSRPLVMLEIAVERMDPNGSVTRAQRTEEFELERDIPIAMGAQWEKTITLRTDLDFSNDQQYLRLYTVGAWMPVVKIDRGAGAEVQKRIIFEPATVRLVPENQMHLADDPLGKLGKAMDAGTVNEVFLCGMLLTEEQKPAGVDMLVAALEKAYANAKKAREKGATKEEDQLKVGMAVISNILTTITGEKCGIDPVKWRKYVDGLRTK